MDYCYCWLEWERSLLPMFAVEFEDFLPWSCYCCVSLFDRMIELECLMAPTDGLAAFNGVFFS